MQSLSDAASAVSESIEVERRSGYDRAHHEMFDCCSSFLAMADLAELGEVRECGNETGEDGRDHWCCSGAGHWRCSRAGRWHCSAVGYRRCLAADSVSDRVDAATECGSKSLVERSKQKCGLDCAKYCPRGCC